MRNHRFIGLSHFVMGLAVVGVLCGGARQVQAQGYNYSILVKTGNTIGGKTLTGFADIVLNDSDNLAYLGSFSGGWGVFTAQSGLLVAPGTIISGKTIMDFSGATINNNNVVSFVAVYSPGGFYGVFRPSGAVVLTGATISGKTLTYASGGMLNNNDDTVITGLFGSGSQGLFTPSLALVIPNETIIDTYTITQVEGLGAEGLNDNGDVLFSASSSGGRGYFTLGGQSVLPGDTIGGKTFTNLDGGSALNNNGVMAFYGGFSGGNGVFTQFDSVAVTGDTIAGKTLTALRTGNPSINDYDEVAFWGAFPDDGIFLQNRFMQKKIVAATGDVIDGKTLTNVGGRLSLNNDGGVAFLGFFSDGSKAIILATPITTPTFTCTGFGAPMNNGPVTVKGNRALPLKGQLRDADNNIITDAGVPAPPVLQVLFDSGMGGDPIDVTDDALPVGQGTDGNQFTFDPVTQEWRYNLSSKNYTAEGTYHLLMMSGNETEYRIDPTCTATFVRE